MSRPRYAVAEKVARDLLRQADVISPAVPVNRLITDRGFKLMYPELGSDASGVLVRKEGMVVIGVNRAHPKTRQRFTAAHELGHALLHLNTDVHHDAGFQVNFRSDLSSKGTDTMEIEANHFAACLLMPREFLEADPDAFLIDVEDATAVASLARTYGVSAHAMGLRLASLTQRKR